MESAVVLMRVTPCYDANHKQLGNPRKKGSRVTRERVKWRHAVDNGVSKQQGQIGGKDRSRTG